MEGTEAPRGLVRCPWGALVAQTVRDSSTVGVDVHMVIEVRDGLRSAWPAKPAFVLSHLGLVLKVTVGSTRMD